MDDDGARALLAAVILQALKDAQKGEQEARCFLRSARCAAFLAWLDFPPEVQADLVALGWVKSAKTRKAR